MCLSEVVLMTWNVATTELPQVSNIFEHEVFNILCPNLILFETLVFCWYLKKVGHLPIKRGSL